MVRRILFGPVNTEFAELNQRSPPTGTDSRTFSTSAVADILVNSADTWDTLRTRFPTDWAPDAVILYLPYTWVPQGIWTVPVPLIGWAGDWSLLWHGYRHLLPLCDLALSDGPGTAALGQQGITHVRAANLFACQPEFWDALAGQKEEKDIDILFVGNVNPAVQRDRLPWLTRVAGLADRWRVVIRTHVFGSEYRQLLARARIVFNFSHHGECNLRVFEAAAAKALLFQEAGNLEVGRFFRDRTECVFYSADNLEELLDYYLTNESERLVLAEAAHRRGKDFTLDRTWEDIQTLLDGEWADLVAAARKRSAVTPSQILPGRCWQALNSSVGIDPTLRADLEAEAAGDSGQAAAHCALGLLAGREPGGERRRPSAAAEFFQRALTVCPNHVIAGLNLAEALAEQGQFREAAETAGRMLACLDRAGDLFPDLFDCGHYPVAFDFFRVEWERVAWQFAGRPDEEVRAKTDLLRWRLNGLLAELMDDLVYRFQAVLHRPDIPVTRAALGCTLARLKRPWEALTHLRQAASLSPLDLRAVEALYHALGEMNQRDEQDRMVQERRRLARAMPQLVPVEKWFAPAPDADRELVSVVIVCSAPPPYTRLCLDSVLRFSRKPFEIIVVEGPTTEDLSQYREQLRSEASELPLQWVRDDSAAVFPRACHRGVRRARGDFLVFLRNDTVVTPGWLEGLTAWAVHDWPAVGMVGPATNNPTAEFQRAEAEYADQNGLNHWAGKVRERYSSQAAQVESLGAFCFLTRRDVWERAGGFDDQFSLAPAFEEDFCRQLQQQGLKLLVALNVFVHCYSRPDLPPSEDGGPPHPPAGYEQFAAKWGRAAADHCFPWPRATSQPQARDFPPPDQFRSLDREPLALVLSRPAAPAARPPEVTTGTVSTTKVSLCMIVRNEEHHLADCLKSAADLFDEVVIVDTGSDDRTKEIARGFTAKVFDFPWVDDFAAARNESLRHATGSWIMWLDADDRLDGENRARLKELFANLPAENVAFVMKCLCLPDAATGTATVVDHVRLFRNHPQIRWQYRVHEQILLSVRNANGEVRWSDVVIHHVGYRDPALRGRKLERDLRLLKKEIAEHPEDPFALFNLGWTYHELQQPEKALPLLRASLGRSHVSDSIVRKLYTLTVQCHRELNQLREALTVCRVGISHCPDDAELLFEYAVLLQARGDWDAAKSCFEKLLVAKPGNHFASVDPGLRGYKARHRLALIFQHQSRWADAEIHWRTAVEHRPDFLPAWLGLAECALAQAQWGKLTEITRQFAETHQAPLEAAVFQARALLARTDFASAKQLLRQTTQQFPHAIGPRVLLSRLLLSDGNDRDAAELTLRELLALDPGHDEARRNLENLLRHPQ
jgi:glycosyltransferase involved in cell wall biosynthesis/Flp pilus assembly protein TadD